MKIREEKLRESFPHFMEVVWAFLELPTPDRLQWDIAEYLQHGPQRRFICGLRGIGKSYATCAYVDWRGWLNPEIITVVRSGTDDKAKSNITLMRDLLAVVPLLRHMVPRSNESTDNLLKDKDGERAFNFGNRKTAGKDASVAAYGIGGNAVGSHPHLHIDDDVETPTNSMTVGARKALRALVSEREKMIQKPNGEIVILGTFQSVDSIYKDDLERIDARFYPARYPKAGRIPHKFLAPILRKELDEDPSLVGKPTLPERFTEETLMFDEAENSVLHAVHMLLDPEVSDAERRPLKLRNFIVHSVSPEIAPATITWGYENRLAIKSPGYDNDGFYGPSHVSTEWLPYQESIMVVDPSGNGPDETAWVCLHMLNGLIFVSTSGGTKDGHSDATLTKLARVAEQQKINRIMVEPNFGGGMYTKLLQSKVNQLGLGIEVVDGDWAKNRKYDRIISGLEPAMNVHRIIIDHSVAADFVLMSQVAKVTREDGCLEHDDRIDCLADGVRYFTDRVVIDAKKRLDEIKNAQALKAILDFQKECRKPGPNRVVTPLQIGLGTAKKVVKRVKTRGWI